MSVVINNTALKKMYLDDVQVKKWVHDDVVVYSATETITQTGSIYVKHHATESVYKSATFSKPFLEKPTVTFTLSGDYNHGGCGVSSVSTTGVTFSCWGDGNGSKFQTYYINWKATGLV